MKNITIAMLVVAFSAVSFAQSRPELERKVRRLTNKIEREVQQIRNDIYYSDISSLRENRRKLRQALDILKGFDNPYPNPDPNPFPNPGAYSVSGSLEKKSFLYQVGDALDLASQCIAQFKSGYSNSDEATVSVDFSNPSSLSTTGWWKSAGQACVNIAAKAVTKGLPASNSFEMVAVGSIESRTVLLKAYNLHDMMVSCQNFYASSGLGNVDEITVLTKSGRVRNLTTSGWWTNGGEVCNQIIQAIK